MAKESFEDSSVKCQLLLIAVVFPDTQEMIFLTTFMIRVVSTTSLKKICICISVCIHHTYSLENAENCMYSSFFSLDTKHEFGHEKLRQI